MCVLSMKTRVMSGRWKVTHNGELVQSHRYDTRDICYRYTELTREPEWCGSGSGNVTVQFQSSPHVLPPYYTEPEAEAGVGVLFLLKTHTHSRIALIELLSHRFQSLRTCLLIVCQMILARRESIGDRENKCLHHWLEQDHLALWAGTEAILCMCV